MDGHGNCAFAFQVSPGFDCMPPFDGPRSTWNSTPPYRCAMMSHEHDNVGVDQVTVAPLGAVHYLRTRTTNSDMMEAIATGARRRIELFATALTLKGRGRCLRVLGTRRLSIIQKLR
jgi:hypothetical protein